MQCSVSLSRRIGGDKLTRQPLYSGFLNREIGITLILFYRVLRENRSMISVHEISKDEVLVTLTQNVSPEQAEKTFKEVMRTPHHKVTIDCAELTHMDHKILGKLYMLNLDLQISRRSLVLAGCSAKIRSLLHLTKIDERIELAANSSPENRLQKPQP